MPLPHFEDFPQLLEEMKLRRRKKFADKCKKAWPNSAQQMANYLSSKGFPMSEGKCLYMRNPWSKHKLFDEDVAAIELLITLKAEEELKGRVADIESEMKALRREKELLRAEYSL